MQECTRGEMSERELELDKITQILKGDPLGLAEKAHDIIRLFCDFEITEKDTRLARGVASCAESQASAFLNVFILGVAKGRNLL